MKDLVSYDSTAAESLLTQIKNFFMSKGIVKIKARPPITRFG